MPYMREAVFVAFLARPVSLSTTVAMGPGVRPDDATELPSTTRCAAAGSVALSRRYPASAPKRCPCLRPRQAWTALRRSKRSPGESNDLLVALGPGWEPAADDPATSRRAAVSRGCDR